ncbi:MAG: PleD family two-component system response regulator, partial [Alphaproteobacteria bacterium]
TADNGKDALSLIEAEQPDIVLLDIMMPGMDGFEVCRRIKANSDTQHIPVVIITALDSPSDRVQGLEAGADDFLTKPINDVALMARVRSLVRLKMVTDELRLRAATGERMGLVDHLLISDIEGENGGRILLVDDRASSRERVEKILGDRHSVIAEENPQQALFRAAEGGFDLLIVSLGLRNTDSLRLCSQMRSVERTRGLPILVISDAQDTSRLVHALDLGVNDYITRPVEGNELMARVRIQLRRKRYADQLKAALDQSMELAIIDPLTQLHNRRYLDGYLATLMEKTVQGGKPVCVVMLDIDHFKNVNDTHGHDVGDIVLREFSRRLKSAVRGHDLACRIGGEEFVVVMPDTQIDVAITIAERLCGEVRSVKFLVSQKTDLRLPITVSAGVSILEGASDSIKDLLRRADQALYRAKRDGRDRVVSEAA